VGIVQWRGGDLRENMKKHEDKKNAKTYRENSENQKEGSAEEKKKKKNGKDGRRVRGKRSQVDVGA